MMFEELFSRKKQTKTTARTLPKEIDAVRKVSGGKNHGHSSSMTVDQYLWINRIVVGCIVLLGVGIIAAAAYGLISDFVIHSDGIPVGSSSVQPTAAGHGE